MVERSPSTVGETDIDNSPEEINHTAFVELTGDASFPPIENSLSFQRPFHHAGGPGHRQLATSSATEFFGRRLPSRRPERRRSALSRKIPLLLQPESITPPLAATKNEKK